MTRSDVQLHEATFQHHTEHQKPMIGCNKTGTRTVCANVPYFLDGSHMVRSIIFQEYNFYESGTFKVRRAGTIAMVYPAETRTLFLLHLLTLLTNIFSITINT